MATEFSAVGSSVDCIVDSTVSCPVRVGEFDGVDLDAVKGLRSRFGSMSKDRLVCL